MATRRLILLALAIVVLAGVAVKGGAAGAGECGTDSTSQLAPCVVLPGVVAPLEGRAGGAGECGASSIDRILLRMAPCFPAMDDPEALVSGSCCSAVHTLVRSPGCLCSAFLSDTRPEIAVTIPKRCNIADRPVGYKCGDYTMP